jgi:diguanylate cyclase (GGDEF)-like protein
MMIDPLARGGAPDSSPPSVVSIDLGPLGEEVSLPAGALLWREGEPGDHVVLLREGTLEVTHEPEEGERLVLRTMYPGAVVGEMAALDGQTRSATVRARTAVELLRIPAGRFREFLRARPDVLEQLFWLQLERVRSLTTWVKHSHRRAITDPLTRLYNVGFFRERLELELDRARATGDAVSLVLFDLDHFKHYNDTRGHEEGNEVLRAVAEILRGTSRRSDLPARYGGEEFVTLLYGATREEAAGFADKVRRELCGRSFLGGASQPLGRVTLSAGVATFPFDAGDEATLVRAADARLYLAKQAGRNRVMPWP